MNLVRAVVEPRPAPVIVEPAPTVVEKTVVVEKPVVVATTTQKVVTTAPGTVIVTETEEVVIPEYDYVLYEDEYIPHYEGWLFLRDEWHWAGTKPHPAAPPKWTPLPRHQDRRPHKIIVLPGYRRGHAPAPVIRHEGPHYVPAFAARREDPRREPARTTVVRQEKQEAKQGAPQKHDAPPKKR